MAKPGTTLRKHIVLLGVLACSSPEESDSSRPDQMVASGGTSHAGGSPGQGTGGTGAQPAGGGGATPGAGGQGSGAAPTSGGASSAGGRDSSGGDQAASGGLPGVDPGPTLPRGSYPAGVENTGADCSVASLSEPDALPKNPLLPDPFQMLDGTRMTQVSQWRCRRQEILRQAEKYIYGEKPTPELVSGSVVETNISVHVEDQGSAIDFSAQLVLPPVGEAPFPALINVGTKGGFGGLTLGESRILEQGVAIIYYDHYELGAEGTPEQSRGQPNPGKFYDLYGGFHPAGLLMAWAWGASRVIDVLFDEGTELIDPQGLGVTGCSRNGKGAFAIGVFDERIALTIPHETSTGGVPAYRVVDELNTERTDHNFYGLNWLSNDFEPFVLNASQLPIDTHSLVAMIAPRGLLVLENPHQRQFSAPAGHIATAAGARVYEALGAKNNVSYHSDVAGTPHCSYKEEYTELLLANIETFLKHESTEPGEIRPGSSATGDLAQWVDWEAPALSPD